MVTQPQPYRFTVDEFEQMGAAGILGEDDRIELIAGEIIQMAAIGVKHANCVRNLIQLLSRAVPDGLILDAQNPIRIRNDGEPQPDLAVIKDRTYQVTPSADDVLFVIEVSDSTIAYDRTVKLPLYASAGIAEAWLVDVNAGILERHTEPHEGAYRQVAVAWADESLISTVVPSITIPVTGIMR